MRWTPGGVSSDIEDRRGSSGFRIGGGGAPLGIGGAVVLLILSAIFGRNFFSDVGGGSNVQQRPAVNQPVAQSADEQKEVQFVSFVIDDVQRTWERTLPQYQHAKVVLFRDATLPSRQPTSLTPTFPLAVAAGTSISDFDPNLKPEYVQSWDIGLQREITRSLAARLRALNAKVHAHPAAEARLSTLISDSSKKSSPGFDWRRFLPRGKARSQAAHDRAQKMAKKANPRPVATSIRHRPVSHLCRA